MPTFQTDYTLISGSNGATFPNTHIVGRLASLILTGLNAPTHYRKLAEHAWRALNWTPRSEDEARQSAEHLRQPVDIRGAWDMGVLTTDRVGRRSRLIGLMYRTDWFDRFQESLFSSGWNSEIEGEIDEDCITNALANAALRLPFMSDRLGASNARRAQRLARGFIVEEHVSQWFRRHYPTMWLPASNTERWSEASVDDFRMRLGHSICSFDVKRPISADGLTWGPAYVGQRLDADVYLLASAISSRWYLVGFATAREFRAGVDYHRARPINRLVVRLNCKRDGVNYGTLKHIAIEEEKRRYGIT
jgi:hypothetical protein